MARRYDTRTTIFSPEGRLYQVEYAMEAISHAGTCLGILSSDGILIAAEKRNVHKLLDDSVLTEKIYRLSDNIACTVAGITADANILINRLRYWAADYKLNFGEPMPVEQLVQTATRSSATRRSEASGRSASRSSTSAGINTTDTSSTSPTPAETTPDGRPLASETTTRPPSPFSSRCTRAPTSPRPRSSP
ncbi:hypothetical protein L596_009335 [Steinernema carpocapsae]|uniref:Proteasome subunit alpha type n=1 Tax=Steinernema carpocapsae TaxID=34508 RepID=A0A4U5PFK5_STECR|nr:hypothetical protein L596_009335 [Steinernema carpocapsae]